MEESSSKKRKYEPKIWPAVWPEGGLTDAFLRRRLAEFSSPPAPDEMEKGNYALHWRALRGWFASQGEWTVDKVILGSLAVYGWMPSILEGRTPKDRVITEERAQSIANALNGGKEDIDLDFVNGSPVGTSKFLHFWRPHQFAIWDSRVRMALVGDCKEQISATDECRQYLLAMRELVKDLPTEEQRAEAMRQNEQRLFWAKRA